MSNINTLDLVFFITTFLIVLVATYRGFIKEFFSVINWTIAFALSYLLSPFLSKFLVNYFESKLILNISVRIGLFIFSFIIFMLLTSNFVEDLTFSFNVYINKFFGAFFGFFKSILIFGLIYSLYNCFFDYALGQKLIAKNTNKMPSWYTNSYSSSVIDFAGNIIDPAVRGFIGFLKINYSEVLKVDKKIEKKIENKFKYDTLKDFEMNDSVNVHLQQQNPNEVDQKIPDQPKVQPNFNIKNDSGYDKKDIEKMQKLIEIINK